MPAVEQVLGFYFISIVEMFMCAPGCSSDCIILQAFIRNRWRSPIQRKLHRALRRQHTLTHFCFQKAPGLKNLARPASHTTRPIRHDLFLPKCKSFCSVTSLQMFLHSIWTKPIFTELAFGSFCIPHL